MSDLAALQWPHSGALQVCEHVQTPGAVVMVMATCSNGVGRTGVFLALHIVLERMMVEGLVDVFQTVKNLRIQRPAMVQTLVCVPLPNKQVAGGNVLCC